MPEYEDTQETSDDQSAIQVTESGEQTSEGSVADVSTQQPADDQGGSQQTIGDQSESQQTTEEQGRSQAIQSGEQTSPDAVTDENTQQTPDDQNTNQATQSTAQSISIAYDVELIPQPTTVSCWAAALAMIISCRDQASYTADDVASRVNMNTAKGYGWKEIHAAVSAWNLNEEGPMSAMPDYWARLLESCGPLWIVEVGAPAHAVVVVGMHGDGTPDKTKVTINNPSPPNQGKKNEEKTFLAFSNEFGLAARANAMIVHK
jgi:Papain-like cysteine protease AvrRpt2